MQVFRRTFMVLVVALAAGNAIGEVEMPAMFSDHMVLQRGRALPVWGWADAGEKVTVSIAGRSASSRAGDDGRWELTLGSLPAGGPHVLTIKGANTLTISDVLVGDVWLCSGQSNMAMTVKGAKNYQAEQAAANYPRIRHFKTAASAAPEPQERCTGSWAVCGPETVGAFTATGYFFGRELHRQLDVPIGLVNSSWGGTAVEAWTSWPAQKYLKPLESLHKEWSDNIAAYRSGGGQGPIYKSMSRKGDAIVIQFDHLGAGLVAKGDKLLGFAVAGADKNFVWADAKIVGDTVVVSSPQVMNPEAVRYAWAPNPKCNLYNSADQPASPFRTDNWPIEVSAGRR